MNLNSDFHRNVNDTINDVVNILNKAKITYWLDYGSLLAAVRDKKLFDWEHDLDFGMFYNDLEKILVLLRDFEKIGYKVRIEKDFPFIDGLIQIYLPQKFSRQNACIDHIDFYLYKKYQDGFWLRQLQWPRLKFIKFNTNLLIIMKILSEKIVPKKSWKRKLIANIPFSIRNVISRAILKLLVHTMVCRYNYIPLKFFQEFKEIKFYGKYFKVPKDTGRYLSMMYGENWQIPNPNWSWKTDNLTQRFLPGSMLGMPEVLTKD